MAGKPDGQFRMRQRSVPGWCRGGPRRRPSREEFVSRWTSRLWLTPVLVRADQYLAADLAGTCSNATASTSLWLVNVSGLTLPGRSSIVRHSHVLVHHTASGWKRHPIFRSRPASIRCTTSAPAASQAAANRQLTATRSPSADRFTPHAEYRTLAQGVETIADCVSFWDADRLEDRKRLAPLLCRCRWAFTPQDGAAKTLESETFLIGVANCYA